MDFYIFYEHINREIENDTLLKNELQKRGYSVKIVDFHGPGLYEASRKRNRAKVVVTPWLRYDSNVYKYTRFAQKPYKLVNLQWEQVYNNNGIKSGLTDTRGEAEKAYHICWGENAQNRLHGNGIPKALLPITGAMQMDYGRPEMKGYYLPREALAEEFSLSLEKPWIILVSNFAYAHFPQDALDTMAKKYGPQRYDTARLHRDSLAETLRWIDLLLQEIDCEFIYRPHPSENVMEDLTSMAEKHKNFRIISKYSVKQWVKCCQKVDLWMSTSNAEILSMGVDYCMFRPYPFTENQEVESMRGDFAVTTYEEFLEEHRHLGASSPERIKEKLERLRPFYDYDPETPTYVRIADELERILKSEKGGDFSFTLKQKLTFGFKECKAILVSFFMEKQLENPARSIVDKLPVKEIIKSNMKKMLKKHQNKEEVEAKMDAFIAQRKS